MSTMSSNHSYYTRYIIFASLWCLQCPTIIRTIHDTLFLPVCDAYHVNHSYYTRYIIFYLSLWCLPMSNYHSYYTRYIFCQVKTQICLLINIARLHEIWFSQFSAIFATHAIYDQHHKKISNFKTEMTFLLSLPSIPAATLIGYITMLTKGLLRSPVWELINLSIYQNTECQLVSL
jgi:hypothetical protein